MAKNNELQLDELENGAVKTETKKSKKLWTDEEIAVLEQSAQKMQEFGVSENLAKLFPLALAWRTESVAEMKEQVIEEFGGSEKFKDWVDTDLSAEVEVFIGIGKIVSVMNNIKSFYARRASKGSRRVKLTQVSIGGEFYQVSTAYLEEISGSEPAEKRELLLAHPATKKVEAAEII